MPDRPGEVVIGGIQGDDGRLTLDATQNCAGVLTCAVCRTAAAVCLGAVRLFQAYASPAECRSSFSAAVA